MRKNRTNRVGLIGIPFAAGQPRPGVELAPAAIREAGLAGALVREGWEVTDFGNLAMPSPDMRARGPFLESERIAPATKLIADNVSAVLSWGEKVVSVGGDHGLALGTIAGALRVHPELRLIWVDAHADSNTPESSPSGNFHGMPLAALLGLFGIRGMPGFEWLGPALRPDRVALIGVRDLDPGEGERLRAFGVPVYSTQQVRARGARAVIDECLSRIDPQGISPLHYSVDIDALDPGIAPGTGLQVKDGLSLAEIETIGRQIAWTERMVSMDLVEINPSCVSPREREITLSTGVRTILASLYRSSGVLDEAS